MHNKKKILFLVVSILMSIIGISYAYYEAVVHGTGNTNAEGDAHTATIQDLILTGTTEVVNTNMIPGETSTYSFTIENPNDFQVCFGIYFDNVVNTFINTSDLEVSMNGEVGLFPTTDDTSTIVGGFRAPANATTSYTLTITYKDVEGKDQTGDMGAIFSGIIKARTTECGLLPVEKSLAKLTNLNSSYVLSNSNKCLQVDENGMILNPTSTMSDEEEPIICTMEDDYGTSYYLRGNHQDNNVKFANMCWKLIRITGTGGYKLIYNGDLDANGKCTTTSGNHTGFTGQTLSLSGNKVYGSSYTKEGTTYTLTDTSTMDWTNDSASIIGKYTCGDTSTSCATLYVVTGEYSSSGGYVLKLDQSTNYAQIGTSAFNYYNDNSNNAKSSSPALVGYMYNDTYPNKSQNLSSNTNNYYYGESFTYNNGSYTLNNTVQFADVSDSTNKTSLNTHHYTCFNATDTTCTEMYYIYYLNRTTLYYIKLNGNETGPDALNKMVNNNDINVKNSHIKGTIDWWYEQNIKNTEYDSKLEDTIFCNDRTIDDLGGWSETGSLSSDLKFSNNKYYLKCPNKRDAFTVDDSDKGNNVLTYPIGLLTTAEHSLTGNNTANKTGSYYWASAPRGFVSYNASERGVDSSGPWNPYYLVRSTYGARPSISLKHDIEFSGGDGTMNNPFVVNYS